MRMGQILLESGLLNPRQLSEGLQYATAKSIFLGRALQLLKFVEAADIDKALRAQMLINMGLSPVLAIDALKRASKDNLSLDEALQQEHLAVLKSGDVPPPAEIRQPDIDLSVELSADELIRAGDTLLIEDECSQAEAYYKLALSTIEKSSGDKNADVAPVLVRLGNTYLATGAFDQAKECYERVLIIRTSTLHEDHPLIAQAHESLADLYVSQADQQRAMESFLAALDVLERNLPGQLAAYAAILKRLTRAARHASPGEGRNLPVGEILKSAGLLSDGELQIALRMSKQSSLPLGIVLRENCMVGDRELQSALKAQFCVRQGVLSEELAIDLLVRASRRRISLERLLHEAGVLVSDEEKFEVYRQIAADLDQLVAAESSCVNSQQDLAPIAYRLGALYEQVGDQVQAGIYYSRALSIWGSAIQGDLTAAKACSSLAKIYHSQNRFDEVVTLLRKAFEHREHALGLNHDETLDSLEALAQAELEAGDADKALKLAQQAVSCREQLAQPGTELLTSIVLAGDCLLKMRDFEGALAEYRRAMAIAQPQGAKPTAALSAVMEKQANLFEQQKKINVAIPLYKSALMILEAAGKKDSKLYENLDRKVAKLEEGLSKANA